ncbi:MAG: 3-hydroxyacyl-ACP dehydratase FabZ [Fimbriimonadaceae bacterium]|nr:3-hydroxyacyl-ACP dehydratase FabZ [Fimbriimonadaceae bacterium]
MAEMLIGEILKTLPHRYPILLVDRILEVEPGKRVRGLKNVTMNEDFFNGHYPGLPLMPGVLILEAIAQAGAVIMMTDPAWRNHVPVIGAIDKVKMRRMVIPGDQMILDVELLWFKARIGRARGTASVDGETAVEMELTFKLVERGPETPA